jgi:pantothenate kinase-related protein Tda10
MDAWLVLAVESPRVVYHWRLQAEQRMRELGRGALTDEQVCVCWHARV